jgi:DNA-binding response OmpR family regulator
MRILIIDDDELVVRALRRALSRFEVVFETSALRALERAALETFDLVLCDLHMPEMRGDELLASLPPCDTTLHLLMSGDGERGSLSKPFTLRELWAAVDALKVARCA